MEVILGKFALLYLLAPLAGILLGGLMLLIAKKNKLLENKSAVYYFLFSSLILAVPALLGLIDYRFMPKAYLILSALYLLLGYVNIRILKKVIDNPDEKPYRVEFLCTFFIGIIGAALFSLVFNLCNELQYGLWASSCMISFLFPSLFLKTVDLYLDIPLEVYKTWSYDKEKREIISLYMDSNKTIVVEMELSKQLSDKKPLNIKVKASEDMPFGLWFKILIDDYNKKSPLSPVDYVDNSNYHEWLFYVHSTVWSRKKHIDPDLSFAENKIREKNSVIAKRVQYENMKKTAGENETI
jgi:hypothetical protein